MDSTTIGIDVSKAKLDMFILSSNELLTFSNDKQGYKKLLSKIKDNHSISRIIIEHTGNYQRGIVEFLQAQAYPVSVVNPGKVRNFAKAMGILAKTDKLDAYVLARYGELVKPEITPIKDLRIKELKELVDFRQQLVATIKQYKNRLEKKPSSHIEKEIKKLLKGLEKQKQQIESELKEYIKQDTNLTEKFNCLNKIKGIGEKTIYVLLSDLPELGQIDRQQLAALCGLAPINHDSGKLRGTRSIYGGRKSVRNALYMAATSAKRFNPVIYNHYNQLRDRGKLHKVALVACMRKLIIHANSAIANL